MKLDVHRFVMSRIGRLFSRIWYAIVPSFPIRRTLFGLTVYTDSRDNAAFWYQTRKHIETADHVAAVLNSYRSCHAWDVGCNIGVYSVFLASRFNRVIAFDISPKAIGYLRRNALENDLSHFIIPVAIGLSVDEHRYSVPETASPGNAMTPGGFRTQFSMSFTEAAHRYGTPRIIKMDIEGHETAFLKSPEFRKWVKDHDIDLLVEVHDPILVDVIYGEWGREFFIEHIFGPEYLLTTR